MLIQLLQPFLHPITEVNFNTVRYQFLLNNPDFHKLVWVVYPQELYKCPALNTQKQLLQQVDPMYCILLPNFSGDGVTGVYFRSINPQNRFHHHVSDNHKTYIFGFYNSQEMREKTYEVPMVFTEGIFDALAIYQYYPYVLPSSRQLFEAQENDYVE